MNHQFCTSCGIQTRVDQKHCEECGHRLNDDSASGQPTESTTEPTAAARATAALRALFLPVNQKHSTLFTWLEIGSKTLAVGSPLAALFDFLSPRVSLLPISATIAVVGLLTTIALRKFVAPSLPPTSKLRGALAPEAGMFKSRLLIGTGLLSALMVTGAAWSSAKAQEGGIIASKFDAARVAQMQVGILQGMQKEQRQQTAVLEDIREGRAADPRRELGNIGGGFNDSELDAALDRGDSRTARLLLAGGFKWRVSNAYTAYASGDPKMPALLLENMAGFELRAGDCERLVEEKYIEYDSFILSGVVLKLPISKQEQLAKPLEPFKKELMKRFCAKTEVQTFIKGKTLEVQQAQQKLARSREICVRTKTTGRVKELRYQQLMGKDSCVRSDCSYSGDRIRMSAHDEKEYAKVVQDVCWEEYPYGASSAEEKVRDMSQRFQEILQSIS